MKVLVDTNVLLRARDAENPAHTECIKAIDILEQNGCYPNISIQILAEFWVVATRPSDMNGMGLPVEAAMIELERIRNAFPCLLETPETLTKWIQLLKDQRVIGRQAHDARLAAIMLSHDLKHILTLNPTDFKRYTGVNAITPTDLIADPNIIFKS